MNIDGRGDGAHWPAGSLLAALTDGDRLSLLALGTRRTFRRGSYLLHQGESPSSVLVLTSGMAKVLGERGDGSPSLLAIRLHGDLVGEFGVLDGGPRSASVVAATDVAVVTIDGGRFRAVIRDHGPIGLAVQRSLVAKVRSATEHRTATSAATALIRIAGVLLQLADRYGRLVSGGILIDVPLSQSDLAALAGVSSASAHRALTRLRHSGAIVTRRSTVVVVDRGGLLFG